MRREHGGDHRYAGYVLRAHPDTTSTPENGTATTIRTTRPETPEDAAAIREINVAAFPSQRQAKVGEIIGSLSLPVAGDPMAA